MNFRKWIILTTVLCSVTGLVLVGGKEICACGPKTSLGNLLLEKAAIVLGLSWRAPRRPV